MGTLVQTEGQAQTLTDRQRRFAEFVASGESKINAYSLAGYRTKGDAAHVEASRLLKKPAIDAYLKDLRRDQKSRAVATRQRKRELLCDIMEGRVPGTSVADMIRAIQVDNLMTGDNKPIKVEGEITLKRVLDAIGGESGPGAGEESLRITR